MPNSPSKEIQNTFLPESNNSDNNQILNTSYKNENNYISSPNLFSQNITENTDNYSNYLIPYSRSNNNKPNENMKKNDNNFESIISNTVGRVDSLIGFLNPFSFDQSNWAKVPPKKFPNQNPLNFNSKQPNEKENVFNAFGILKKVTKKGASKGKNNKFDYYKDKVQKVIGNKAFLTGVSACLDIYSCYQEIKKPYEQKIDYEEAFNYLDKKNINQLSLLEKKELEEKANKRVKEEREEKKLLEEGTHKWNCYKAKLIESIIREIDYMNLIEEIFENYLLDFKSDINDKIWEIFNNDFKFKFSLLIHQKHHSTFLAIKNSIPQIETLNLIIVGFAGVGKSCLTNALLKFNEAEESNGILSATQTFKKYSNPKIPGITIYDTVGIEPTNKEKNIPEIKKKIKETFDVNLEDSHNSLHKILYCIKNGFGTDRIGKEEIELIDELDKLNGNDILTVIFTQSLNNETEKRRDQLKKDLNNKNIEIIDILAKDYIIKKGNQNIKINAFGLDKLIFSIKKNAKKVVRNNLKQIAKNKKKKYILKTLIKNIMNYEKK